jgi:Kef-type K+ transport system membrane component KefB
MTQVWIFLDPDEPSNPFPIFLIQVFLTLIITRVLGKVLGYVKQPPVVGEMIGGILLGPSVLGLIPGVTATIWPAWSMGTFHVASNIGLMFFVSLLPRLRRGGPRVPRLRLE